MKFEIDRSALLSIGSKIEFNTDDVILCKRVGKEITVVLYKDKHFTVYKCIVGLTTFRLQDPITVLIELGLVGKCLYFESVVSEHAEIIEDGLCDIANDKVVQMLDEGKFNDLLKHNVQKTCAHNISTITTYIGDYYVCTALGLGEEFLVLKICLDKFIGKVEQTQKTNGKRNMESS